METPKKIRLFVDAHSFDKEHQGTRAFIRRLYTALLLSSPDIEIFFGAYSIENLKKEFKGVRCQFIQYRFGSSLARLIWEFPTLIRKYRIDLAHFQYISPFYKNCKTIVTTHDLLFMDFREDFSLLYRLSRHLIFKRSIRQADIKSTVSEYSKAAIVRHFGVAAGDIIVLKNGVPADFFKPYDKTEARKYIRERYHITRYILCVSRIEPRKNHAALLKAYLHLKLYEKGYQLVLIGFTSIRNKEFSRIYSRLQPEVRKLIYTNESVNDDDLSQFYKGSEVFVFPSKSEGFGLPPLEAAAMRIPVLCPNTTAMAEFSFFEPHRFDPNDENSLSQKLAAILAQPPDQLKLDQIAREICEKYTFEDTVQKLLLAINSKFANRSDN